MSAGAWSRKEILLLAILVLVAIGLRGLRSPTPSAAFPGTMTAPSAPSISDPPSMDEIWHLALSTGRGSPFNHYPRNELLKDVPAWTSLEGAPPWYRVWTSLDGDFHPPLYVQTLRIWRELLGESDRVAIAYSAFWSLLALVFVFAAGRRLFGPWGGGWSGLAMALSPTQVYYGLELRGYCMLVAFSSMVLYVVVRIREEGDRPWLCAWLGTGFVALMLTHYFALPICIAAALLAWTGQPASREEHAADAPSRLPGGWRIPATALLAAAAWSLVWLPFALRQIRTTLHATGFLHPPDPIRGILVDAFLRLPLRLLAELPPTGNLTWMTLLGALLTVGGIVVSIREPRLRVATVWLLAVGLSLLAGDLAGQTRQLLFIRYAAAATPGAVLVAIGLAYSALRRERWLHLGGIATMLICLFSGAGPIRADSPTQNPAAQQLAGRLEPGDSIVVYSSHPGDFIPDSLLLELAHVPGLFPRDAILLDRPALPELAASLRGPRAWLLVLTDDFPPDRLVPGGIITRVERFQFDLEAMNAGAPPKAAYLLRLPGNPG